MPWIDLWRRIVRSTNPSCSNSSSGNVHDELMFHFRELVNEKVAEGQPLDTAWTEAEKQFGSLAHYENECHAMQMEHRLGWRMTGAFAVLLLLAYGAWSLFEIRDSRMANDLHALREDLAALKQGQAQAVSQEVPSVIDPFQRATADLVGQVFDIEDRPLAETTVLVILKTWPNGRYQQQDFKTTTDAKGHFSLARLIPVGSKYAVQVAALKEGFAFHSFYHLKEQDFEQRETITLRLEPASHVTLVVRNNEGLPIPNVKVMPFARESQDGNRHQIYFQGSDSIRQTTDAEGRVRFGCFLTGDTAEVYVQLPGQEWDNRSFDISKDDFVVELASTAVVVN